MGGARSTDERPRASKRFLSVLSDERLSQRVRRGDEAAFEVLFDRHQRGVSALCASITRSPDDGEEVAQQTFLAAYRALRSGPRPERVRPWLYAIARNRSISELRRGHRAHEAPDAALDELPGPDMDDAVERRADLGQLLHDLGELPDDQRAALVLAEAADLPHAEIAAVLSCPPAKVKSLVYQARTGLMSRREARETPCEEFREEIASRRGGALAWTPLRRHLARCPRCSNYLEHVRGQRATFALALPLLAPGLRDAVFEALAEESAPAAAAVGAGIGAGAAGEVAKGGVIAALAGRTGARVAAVLGSGGGLSAPTAVLTKAGAAKAAVAVVTATGATVGGAAVVRERVEGDDAGNRVPATAPQAEREGERRPGAAGAGRERAVERGRAAREAKQRRPDRGRGARRAPRPRAPRFEPRLPRSRPVGPPPARSPKGESPGGRGGGGGGAGAPAVPPPRLPKPPRVPEVPKPPVNPDPPKLPDAPSLLP